MIHPLIYLLSRLDDRWWDEFMERQMQSVPLNDREYERCQLEELKKEGRENAYQSLKERTGQDFGYDFAVWKAWLVKNTNVSEYMP